MAHAYYHAVNSAKHFGGVPEDYMELHQWMDHTKAHVADARHRVLLHNSWGIFLGEQIFGATITRKSDGKIVPVRTIFEKHVIEDIGRIMSVDECLRELPLKTWMFKNSEPLSKDPQE